MKRILSSCLLGVLLTSSVLASPASAQVRVFLGGNDQHNWREQQRERERLEWQRHQLERQRQRIEWQRQQRERLERQHRLIEERQRERRLEEQRRREFRHRY